MMPYPPLRNRLGRIAKKRASQRMATLATEELRLFLNRSESESKSMLCDGPPGGRVEKRYKCSYLYSVGPDARMHQVHDAYLYMYSAPRTLARLVAICWLQPGPV